MQGPETRETLLARLDSPQSERGLARVCCDLSPTRLPSSQGEGIAARRCRRFDSGRTGRRRTIARPVRSDHRWVSQLVVSDHSQSRR